MKIYLIPGLGFDNKIFGRLDFGKYSPEYLNWIEPCKNEDISRYANRMAERIEEDDEVILIGHSFGGIISQEMSRIRKVKKVILISSIRCRKENPLHFRIIAPLFIHKLFTKALVAQTIKYWGKYHGYGSEATQKLVREMIRGHSDKALQWALYQLSKWNGRQLSPETTVLQIHGGKDRTFPLKWIDSPDHIIKDGSHFMVYQKPAPISEWIIRAIEK